MLLANLFSLLLLAQDRPAPDAPPAPTVIVPLPLTGPLGPLQQQAPPLPNSTARVTTAPAAAAAPAPEGTDDVVVRIGDLVDVDGVRSNQLSGLGLVTGLAGTGDKARATKQAIANYVRLRHLNVTAAELDTGNVALVTVTADLPPWIKAGMRIDVAVQSFSGATSLEGGTLLQVPLYGADDNVYVVAQGAIAVGGFTAAGKSATVKQNSTTAAILSGGGIVEKEVPMELLGADGTLHLHLRSPNYTTASRVAREIQRMLPGSAHAIDAATIRIDVPPDRREDAVAFLAELGERTIIPATDAVVVMNERTGTVVAGAHVRISTVAITHGNLTISIAESETASQPQPFSEGQTTSQNRTDVNAEVEAKGLQVVNGGTSVSQLAASLNRIGVAPRDLVAIFQALSQAGALHARLEIR